MKKTNYLSIIDFSDNENYQSAYSTQLYGTFFSIYLKLKTSEKGNHYVIEELNLKLINYKGVIDLGIEDAVLEYVLADSQYPELWKKLALRVAVKAGSSNNRDFPVSVSDKSNKIVKNGTIDFERYVKPMHGGDRPYQALCNGLFDSEFYYREGLFENDEAKRTEHVPKLWIDRLGPGESHGVGGKICPYNRLIVQ